MIQYQFQIYRDEEKQDNILLELPDDLAAWEVATRTCGEIMSDLAGKLWPGTRWRLEVEDETGRRCWQVHFFAEGVDVR